VVVTRSASPAMLATDENPRRRRRDGAPVLATERGGPLRLWSWRGPARAVVEVTVHGVRPPREVTKRTITKDEIEHIPRTHGDALARRSRACRVWARPARSFSNGSSCVGPRRRTTRVFFLDGNEHPRSSITSVGLASVMPSEVLEKIRFLSPGNFSSVYGRGMGGPSSMAGLRDIRGNGSPARHRASRT